MSRTVPGWGWGLLGLAVFVALAAQAPLLLRRIDSFRVERVEVLGTRYLAPHEALAASGIADTSSVFDDPTPWREALLRHPLVADATIARKLPRTLIVTIVEVEPVALVRTPELRAVDAAGRVLPIDPAGAVLDVPIVGGVVSVGEDGVVEGETTAALIEAAARIARIAPGFAERVSEVVPAEGEAVRILLREPPSAEVLLPMAFDAVRLEQLRLTIQDLERRREMPVVRRIDVRFRDQVVVSLNPSANG